ncbi:hypothetical protein BT69DRAFT_507810 [Atractiella rhizophila]|nr:hypothetical protein BT69DRAFT_507810 [Atractiella rhizophila]
MTVGEQRAEAKKRKERREAEKSATSHLQPSSVDPSSSLNLNGSTNGPGDCDDNGEGGSGGGARWTWRCRCRCRGWRWDWIWGWTSAWKWEEERGWMVMVMVMVWRVEWERCPSIRRWRREEVERILRCFLSLEWHRMEMEGARGGGRDGEWSEPLLCDFVG